MPDSPLPGGDDGRAQAAIDRLIDRADALERAFDVEISGAAQRAVDRQFAARTDAAVVDDDGAARGDLVARALDQEVLSAGQAGVDGEGAAAEERVVAGQPHVGAGDPAGAAQRRTVAQWEPAGREVRGTQDRVGRDAVLVDFQRAV